MFCAAFICFGYSGLWGFRTPMPDRGERIISETQVIAQPWSNVELSRLVHLGANGDVITMDIIWFIQSDGEGTIKYLMRFFGPLEGVSVLRIESPGRPTEVILYDPDLGENRKIKKSELADYFYHLGWTFEDLTPETGARFDYGKQGIVMLDGLVCNKIQATPAFPDAENVTRYGSRILWITQDSGDLRKVEFYDWDGGLIKTLRASVHESAAEDTPNVVSRPSRMTLEHFEKETLDCSVTLKRKMQVELPSEIFTEAFIEAWSPEQDVMLLSFLEEADESSVE
ncbi:outer membrane lipoprotein-sorting protein [Rubellicoccus peritrichatus]|uniref:Outer membrane lipoprotein-sorting protein n=1 Tax=Rubellicoccus peritrichatus TaxID=3080537 RepID=A0AAQ3QV48_9BACT|nr:outer membrane lipoprotein-sorting protein [Puniceicoccus sp. CR14]WOO41148.1 outer membrane lipoprotein-sorting protein [Puniceicoccus sp. CR14]